MATPKFKSPGVPLFKSPGVPAHGDDCCCGEVDPPGDCECLDSDSVVTVPSVQVDFTLSSTPQAFSLGSFNCSAPASCPNPSATLIPACNESLVSSDWVFVCNLGNSDWYYVTTLTATWQVGDPGEYKLVALVKCKLYRRDFNIPLTPPIPGSEVGPVAGSSFEDIYIYSMADNDNECPSGSLVLDSRNVIQNASVNCCDIQSSTTAATVV